MSMIRRVRFAVAISLFLLLFMNPSGGNLTPSDASPSEGSSLSQAPGGDVEYLVITSEELAPALQPLVAWKMQRGLISSIVTVETIGGTYSGFDSGEQIRNCIIDYHENRGTLWVVLAGGEYVVPPRQVDLGGSSVYTDYYYSNLDDNWELNTDGDATLVDSDDWEAEVYIGRLPGDSFAQMEDLVARLIQYEKSPPLGPWMTHAVFGGTFCNFNYDTNGNNVLDEGDWPEFDTNRNHNWMRSNILPAGWTATILAEGEGLKPSDYPYDDQLNETTLVAAINQGASVVMTDSHGSSDGVYRTIFTNDQDGDMLFDSGVDSLASSQYFSILTETEAEGRLGMYFLAACSTGTFRYRTCLTEQIVRTCGIGAIGSYGSAGYDSTWYDGEHLGWVSQGLAQRFCEQLFISGQNHPGMALSMAKDDYAIDRAAMAGEDDGGRTLAQYNLMGDPEVPLWLDTTSPLGTPQFEIDASTRELVVDISGVAEVSDGISLTLMGPDFYRRTETDLSNLYRFTLPSLDAPCNFTLTLSRNGNLPCQIIVQVPSGGGIWSYYPIIGITLGGALVAVVLVIAAKIARRP
jgi:hypothetical protein